MYVHMCVCVYIYIYIYIYIYRTLGRTGKRGSWGRGVKQTRRGRRIREPLLWGVESLPTPSLLDRARIRDLLRLASEVHK